MIEKIDTNQLGDFGEMDSDLEIGVAGFKGAGGVVVGNDDPRKIMTYACIWILRAVARVCPYDLPEAIFAFEL